MVKLNIGLHWGATLMVGQVATRGRLEVTALGDQMNEGARIEAAAKDGAILASKDLIERLDSADAETTGLDLDALAYKPLGELDGASDKAIRGRRSHPRHRNLTNRGRPSAPVSGRGPEKRSGPPLCSSGRPPTPRAKPRSDSFYPSPRYRSSLSGSQTFVLRVEQRALRDGRGCSLAEDRHLHRLA